MTHKQQLAFAKRKNITDTWLSKTTKRISNTQIELAITIADNENVSDNTLLELLNKGFSDAEVYMAIAAATENETIAWKIQRILEENEFEWSKSDWESVRHEMIDSLTANWRKHEDGLQEIFG